MTNLNHDGRRCRRGWKIPFFILGIILIKSALVLLLWNFLIPDLFHGPEVSYLQALGITVLVKILVSGGRHGHGHGGHHWKHHWAGLSQEEREKLKEEFKNRCGK